MLSMGSPPPRIDQIAVFACRLKHRLFATVGTVVVVVFKLEPAAIEVVEIVSEDKLHCPLSHSKYSQ